MGVQQGYPLGPFLFCFTVHSLVPQLKSSLKLLFLDDIPVGGSLDDVVRYIEEKGAELGLFLNWDKSEAVCRDHATLGALLVDIPGLSVTDPAHVSLLGSPVDEVMRLMV